MGIKNKDIYDKIRRNNPYFEDFITRSIYHSNAIEGNTISYAETYSIVFNQNDMTITAKPREIYEAINLKYALSHVLQNLNEELSGNLMKELAMLINKNINEIDGFRKGPVYIRGAEHIPPEAAYIPQLVQELLYNYRNSKEDLFNKLAGLHINFERIHPFSDGNGRTGRILIAKELMKNGYPPLVIPLEDRAKYMQFLADQNVSGLAKYFEEKVEEERTRMQNFGISLPTSENLTQDDYPVMR